MKRASRPSKRRASAGACSDAELTTIPASSSLPSRIRTTCTPARRAIESTGEPIDRYAVRPGAVGKATQTRRFFIAGGHHELAAIAMGHAVARAQRIQQFLAAHAQPRLERPRRVVEPRVDHLAVARAHALPDR